MRFTETFASFDWILTGAAVLLLVVGLAMLFGTTSDDSFFSYFFIRQLSSLVIALGAYLVISFFPYHHWRRYAVILYGLGIFSLFFVAQIAPVIRGTTSRFSLYGIQIQPSEFMKVALIVMLAWYFSKKSISNWSFAVSGIIVGVAAALVISEPDVGVAALMVALWASLLIFLGLKWSSIAVMGLAGVVAFFASWVWLFADYQKARIITFFNPASDPLGAGYNVTQALVAFGSGGFFGRGLGHGPQSQLKFLPEKHTDFILASIGEELGFIGVALIVILYFVLLWRILRIADSTEESFGKYLTVGVFLLLLISFFVSAGMNMGLLPVTGVPLPLVSYGGSNLLSTFILLGMVQSVRAYSWWTRRPPAELSTFT